MIIVNRRQALALLTGGAAAAVGATAASQSVKKVAFMMNGTPGDVGWNYEHARGVSLAQATFGHTVQIDSFYNVGEWGEGDADQILELIIEGYDLVFACSMGFGQSVLQMAHGSKSTKFEVCGGFVRAENIATYSARWYEGRKPQGLIAGAMTKTNRIGYLGSFPIPQVIRGINAAYLAAKSVNPNVEFDVVWLNTWFAPQMEATFSNLLLDRGADVLMAHTNSTKPVEVAEARGAFAFGQGSDMSKYGPNATLSATVNNWGPYYVRRIKALIDGSWTSTDTWGGFDQDMIKLVGFSDRISPTVRALAVQTVDGLASGAVDTFEGPINKQDGSTWLSAGQTARDSDLHGMDYYVEGLSAPLPLNG